MPLPSELNPVWPPPHHKLEQRLTEEARAWLVGDLNAIGEFYRSTTSGAASWRRRLIQRLNRDQQDGSESTAKDRLHVPLPRQIARTSASLLFSEPPSLSVPEAHDGVEEGKPLNPEQAKAQACEDRLAELWDLDNWASKLWQAAYVSSGEGGVYLLPTWDVNAAPHPMLKVVHHNRAVPVFNSGHLVEVTVWRVLEVTSEGKYLRHLEVYTAGKVQHALYLGTADRLGNRLSLGARRETAVFEIASDNDGVIDLRPFGIEGVLPEYVPNVLPHVVTLSGDVGGSDTAGLEDQLFALDEADSGWHGDVRVGKRRVIVDESMLERHGRGGGASFDMDQEVYAPLHYGALNDKQGIEIVDFSIRADDFEATVTNRFGRLSIAAGYNPESVNWASTGEAMTATEVLSRDALSADTTGAKQGFFERAIANVAFKCLQIDRFVFGSPLEAMRPDVVWPVTAEDDSRQVAETINVLALAGAISTYEKVKRANPTWDDTQILEEVRRIKEDLGQSVAEPAGPDSTLPEPESDELDL